MSLYLRCSKEQKGECACLYLSLHVDSYLFDLFNKWFNMTAAALFTLLKIITDKNNTFTERYLNCTYKSPCPPTMSKSQCRCFSMTSLIHLHI